MITYLKTNILINKTIKLSIFLFFINFFNYNIISTETNNIGILWNDEELMNNQVFMNNEELIINQDLTLEYYKSKYTQSDINNLIPPLHTVFDINKIDYNRFFNGHHNTISINKNPQKDSKIIASQKNSINERKYKINISQHNQNTNQSNQDTNIVQIFNNILEQRTKQKKEIRDFEKYKQIQIKKIKKKYIK